MTDGMPPQGYNQQPPQQPMQQPGQDDGAFGYQAEPKEEKYNTQYLVSNMNKDRTRNILIIVGVIVAAVLGVSLWAALTPKSEPVAPKAPAITAPAAPAAPAADAAAPKADDKPAK